MELGSSGEHNRAQGCPARWIRSVSFAHPAAWQTMSRDPGPCMRCAAGREIAPQHPRHAAFELYAGASADPHELIDLLRVETGLDPKTRASAIATVAT